MFRNKDKYLQVEIDSKGNTNSLTNMPNPKQISEGALVYVDGKGLYVKYRGELRLISSSAGNVQVNSYKTTNTTIESQANSYSVLLSRTIELYNSGYIMLSQQYGNITDSIKIPVDFTKINRITCCVNVNDGNNLYQKYVDNMMGSMTVTRGNSLEIGIKYDSNFKLSLRVTEKNQLFQNIKQSYFTGRIVLSDGTNTTPNMQEVYTENKLIMFLEMLINVS